MPLGRALEILALVRPSMVCFDCVRFVEYTFVCTYTLFSYSNIIDNAREAFAVFSLGLLATIATVIISHADSSRRGRVLTSVCPCVCLFIITISQNPMQLRSPNLEQKCSRMRPGSAFILGSKGQSSRPRVAKTVTLPVCVFALL